MTNGYERSEEWRRAEDALAVCVGYRIVRTPEVKFQGIISPERFDRQRLDFGTRDGKPGPHVVAMMMSDKATWDLWCEAVKMRIDHAGACGLAWELYAAATGQTISSFNGMPAGEPVAHVRAERKRLLDAAHPERNFAG